MSISHKPLRSAGRPFALVAIAALALCLASCGGGKGAAGSGPESAAQTAEAAAAAQAEAEAKAQAEAAAEAAAAAAAAEAQAQAEAQGQGDAALDPVAQAAKLEAERKARLPVPAPVIKGDQGVYAAAVTVSLSVAQPEALIVYTLDGSKPAPKTGKAYAGPFPVSTSSVLKVMAYVPGGQSSTVVASEYTIGEVCVAAGASGGDGRRGAPLGDIAAAIDKARSLGIPLVKLAAGAAFEASIDISLPITLSGGWKADFSGKGGGYTVVRGLPASSTSKKTPAYALRVSGAKADSGVRLERLELRGGQASYTAGLVVTGGALPVVTDCRGFGGDGSYGYGAAVIDGAAPSFRSCRFSGGDGATSFGLSVDSARATVSSCYLVAGVGTVGGYGLSATDARVRVYSSVLAGSPANVSYGAAFYNCKESSLQGCTVVGGSGKEGIGVFISVGDPAIENCIIAAYGTGKSYGIYDNYGDSYPSRLGSVVFLGCAGGLYYEADTKISYSSVGPAGEFLGPDGKALPKPVSSGCAKGSFSLDAGNDYQTPASSAMAAGKALTGDAAVDVNGKARAEPWTIGAWEL